MKVQVTANHIKRGCRKSMSRCPISLAVKEAGGTYVLTANGVISFEINRKVCDQLLDLKVIEFIKAFDLGKSTKPFSFILKGV